MDENFKRIEALEKKVEELEKKVEELEKHWIEAFKQINNIVDWVTMRR